MNVTRWNHIIEWVPEFESNVSEFQAAPNGDWVDAQDHLAEVQRLQDALLGPVTDEELQAAWIKQGMLYREDVRKVLQAFLAARRARLLAPAKSAEERATFFEVSGKWAVVVDKDREHEHTAYNLPSRKVAEGYRRDVIATLKQEREP